VALNWFVRSPTRRWRQRAASSWITSQSACRRSIREIAKLKAENVNVLKPPYPFGDLRAIMIDGPSRESIEIIGK
jgi:hypothetical protein